MVSLTLKFLISPNVRRLGEVCERSETNCAKPTVRRSAPSALTVERKRNEPKPEKLLRQCAIDEVVFTESTAYPWLS